MTIRTVCCPPSFPREGTIPTHCRVLPGSHSTQRTFPSVATAGVASASQLTVLHQDAPEFGHLRRPQKHQRQQYRQQLPPHAPLPYSPLPSSDPSSVAPYEPSPPAPEDEAFDQSRAVADDEPMTGRPLASSKQQPAATAGPSYSAMALAYNDELVRDAKASITPGVDDTPYIQHALEAMSKKRDSRGVSQVPSSGTDETNPMMRYMPHTVPGLFQTGPGRYSALQADPDSPSHAVDEDNPAHELRAMRALRAKRAAEQGPHPLTLDRQSETPSSKPFDRWTPQGNSMARMQLADELAKPPVTDGLRPRDWNYWRSAPDDPERAEGNIPLTFKPWLLSTGSLLLLMGLTILMIAGLMFCAIYSVRNNGLVAFSGTIYGGQYFVFRILPQCLGAVLLIYTQCVITTMFRVLPFSAMACDDVRYRQNVGFLPLYPKSFLWPQLVSTWQVWVPVGITWVLNFTIPLLSSLFSCILVDGTWTWAAGQGVVWVLVALYVLLLVSTGILIAYWHRRRTGLLPHWDMRSLVDIIFLVAQSNSTHRYEGTEVASNRSDLRQKLYGNADRLGYWSSPEAPGDRCWYGLGQATGDEKMDMSEVGAPVHMRNPRGGLAQKPLRGHDGAGYLPWCFRTGQLMFLAIAAAVLLIALFVVSFLSVTDIRHGFIPGLRAGPVPGAFSAANFLYSFIPSVLGMMLFLLFQSLDLTLRILTPWGELNRPGGSHAQTSLLVDYAACYPWMATWKALRNRHWRVAAISFLANLFILIPILAGGVFMALTPPSAAVRMYPNVPAYGILLALLVLYLAGIVLLLPKREQFRLPHAVTCLAEIIGFCSNDELRTDKAFDFPWETAEGGSGPSANDRVPDRSKWYFGKGPGNIERLGIKRLPKHSIPPRLHPKLQDPNTLEEAKAAILRAPPRKNKISQPVPEGNSTMF